MNIQLFDFVSFYKALMASPVKDSSNNFNLSHEEILRVIRVLSDDVTIPPAVGSLPTLKTSPSWIVNLVRKRLDEKGISVKGVQLQGSGASFCLVQERGLQPTPHYNDLDIKFDLKLREDVDHTYYIIREEVLNSLLDLFPEGSQRDRITSFMLTKAYVKKQVKISSGTNSWSLVSLGGERGMNIELKFVDSIQRDYEFSVDSFQITLDPILRSLDASDSKHSKPLLQTGTNLLLSVYATSLYGNYFEALHHLNKRLLCTKDPEQIRGGGLLKYCYLRAIGYKPANSRTVERLEYRMSNRFFIDFPEAIPQYSRINKYIFTHFPTPSTLPKALDFLDILYNIVSQFRSESELQTTRVTLIKIRFKVVIAIPPEVHSSLPIYQQLRNAPFILPYYGPSATLPPNTWDGTVPRSLANLPPTTLDLVVSRSLATLPPPLGPHGHPRVTTPRPNDVVGW